MIELLPYIEKGGIGGALVLGMYLLGKLIDRYKPSIERRADTLALESSERAAYEQRLAFMDREITKCQSDISELRAELRRMSAERHHFYDAIVRCSIEHPSTSAWWTHELARIKAMLSA